MRLYTVQSRDRIFVKGYGFLSFAKNMGKNLSGKYSQKCATEALKTASKRAIQKTVEATDDLIGTKIADRVTKVSKTLEQSNSETNTNDKKVAKERYIYISRIKTENYWWSKINIII